MYHLGESSPYAFAIWLWFLNPAVTAMQRIMSTQLISGIYIWPRNFFEVCTTLTRGKQPSASACFTIEYVADIVAWLATTAAAVAITNAGQYITSAAITRTYISSCIYTPMKQIHVHIYSSEFLRKITRWQIQVSKVHKKKFRFSGDIYIYIRKW